MTEKYVLSELMNSFWTSAEYTAKFTVRRYVSRKGFCDMKKRNSVLIKKILKYISNYRGYLFLTIMLAVSVDSHSYNRAI